MFVNHAKIDPSILQVHLACSNMGLLASHEGNIEDLGRRLLELLGMAWVHDELYLARTETSTMTSQMMLPATVLFS